MVAVYEGHAIEETIENGRLGIKLEYNYLKAPRIICQILGYERDLIKFIHCLNHITLQSKIFIPEHLYFENELQYCNPAVLANFGWEDFHVWKSLFWKNARFPSTYEHQKKYHSI